MKTLFLLIIGITALHATKVTTAQIDPVAGYYAKGKAWSTPGYQMIWTASNNYTVYNHKSGILIKRLNSVDAYSYLVNGKK